jgi:transposase
MKDMVGVDVAKATFDVAVALDQAGKFRTRAKLVNAIGGFTEFAVWLEKHAPGAAVCMEATGKYHEALATFLFEQGKTVYVVNPAQVKYFAQSQLARTKTDRTDAKLIARFARAQMGSDKPLRPWCPPTPAQRTLRALVERLEDLKAMAQIESNRLDVADASVQPSVEATLGELKRQIKALEKRIDDHIDSNPDLRRDADLVDSIDGIGPTTSAFLLALLGDVRRFKRPGQLVAFVGMNPALRESGTLKGKVRLSKTGAAPLRAKLYMPALVAVRHNPVIRAFYERLRANGKAPLVALCAAMRKLLHLVWGVVHHGKPFDPQHAVA